MRKHRILVIDEAQSFPAYDEAFRAVADWQVFYCGTQTEGLAQLSQRSFDVLIVALGAPNLDGLRLLRQAREVDQNLDAIVVAAQPSVETAQASLRAGAGDYLGKPLSGSELIESVSRLIENRRTRQRNLVRPAIEGSHGTEEFIGASPAMRKVFETIEQIAPLDVDVLVQGETGTGKELVARSIHNRSPRAQKPFVPVDCGAIPENLLESEFFGHERGAFTGADSRRVGLLEFAEGGTFFLDELAELPLLLQAKLLRSLQERRIRRVGGREEIEIDVRVIAATSRDLVSMLRQGLFREELYYRVNVVRIDLPPLRQRGDDLGLLAERFVIRYAKEMGKPVVGITPEAFQVLRQYDWPGNVRELQNVIRRSIALSRERLIGLDNLPDALVESAGEKSPAGAAGFFQARDEHLARFEREYLSALLARHQGNVKTAAVEAKLPRGTLYRIMKNHGLDSADFR